MGDISSYMRGTKLETSLAVKRGPSTLLQTVLIIIQTYTKVHCVLPNTNVEHACKLMIKKTYVNLLNQSSTSIKKPFSTECYASWIIEAFTFTVGHAIKTGPRPPP